jgi:rhomboid protease GluP
VKLTATRILIALNVLVMVVLSIQNPGMLLIPDKQSLIESGANFGILTCSGQQWRLLSSMFLHVGILHLLVNMYALYKVGPPAEDLFGWRDFVVIYLFSGIFGALASCLWNPTLISAGASGAIFGVYGSLLSFMFVQRDQYPDKVLKNHALMAVLFLACNAVYGWLVPEIDSFAHLGGLLAGAFSGFLFAHLQVSESMRNAFTFPILILLTGGMIAVTHVAFDRRGYPFDYQGLQAFKKKDYRMAVEYFTTFLAVQPDNAEACGSRGMSYLKLRLLENAAADFSRVAALAPRSWEPLNDLAWVECGLGQYQMAVQHSTKAIRLYPRAAPAFDTRGYAYSHLGMREDALADYDQAIKLAPTDPAPRYHRHRLIEIASSLPVTVDATDSDTAKKYQPEHWEE